MAKFKQLPLDELYPHIDGLETADQIRLVEHIEKLLATKKAQAEYEMNLINGKKP